MAKGFKHGAGGGGASLNFKVVGNPQPENAKENTIWVDTDVKITSWIFSATEPENPSDGMVWFFTGTESALAFNALKKNGITVYPLTAKQYVDGAWVEKPAKSYLNGEWVEWFNGKLYDGENFGWKRASTANGWYDGELSYDNGMMLLQLSSDAHLIAVVPEVAYDLTKYKSLAVEIDYISAINGHNWIGISNSDSFVWNAGSEAYRLPECIVANAVFSKAGTVKLDISSLTGFYFPTIMANKKKTLKIKSVVLKE